MSGCELDFGFERLEVYKRALEFANVIYETTGGFPKEEQFGITSQLRRASLSISLNIAEGSGRYNIPERRQFYRVSRSSINECVPLIEISCKQGYIDSNRRDEFRKECVELAKMISGLIKSLPTKD